MLDDLDRQINQLENELTELKAEKERRKMPVAHRLADELHMIICHHDHTEYCGYLYEKWEDPGYAKSRERQRINNLLNIVDEETLAMIIPALDTRNYK
jgi:hypothetical protein